MIRRGSPPLPRVVGVPGGILLGLGSILGTGIFVGIGLAAEVAGPTVLLAVLVAGVVATFNGLSSAQLAGNHPVSGGTYEYGYRYLSPTLGFVAGWTFLLAKSASAGTAALGFAGYLLTATGASSPGARTGVGLGLVLLLTLVVAGGMRRSARANALLVGFVIAALCLFLAAGLPILLDRGAEPFQPFLPAGGSHGTTAFLEATALLFVAYTGYGRIATLGEEIRNPEENIPRAIIVTLVLTAGLYLAVTAVAISVGGAQGLAGATRGEAAPLEVVARLLPLPWVAWVVAAAAVVALASVLLNLILGLSRVLLAMARRGDMPRGLAHVDAERSSPTWSVWTVGGVVALWVLVGDVRTTWSFSAFTVLLYYALTNLAATRLPPGDRRFPGWVAWSGLTSCLGLAFWVEPRVWVVGMGLVGAGLVWHGVARATKRSG